MSNWYSSAIDQFSEEVSTIRQRLATMQVTGLSSDAQVIIVHGEQKAFLYVWLSACLEKCIKNLLELIIEELNSKTLCTDDLKPSLLGLLLRGELESVRNLRDYEKTWLKTCELFESCNVKHTAVFKVENVPLDGRTLRPHHFNIIWRVFGFAGQSLPSPSHALALKNLADGRNTVAHGNDNPSTFGRTKISDDISKLTHNIEDIVLHFANAADVYLSKKEYYK